MFLIQQITAAPLQKMVLVLEDGTEFSLELYYRPIQQSWCINQLVYQNFTLNGLRITNSINMLNQFRNVLPFGLACITKGNREPSLQQDFSSQTSKLYVLSAAEVEEYAEYLSLG